MKHQILIIEKISFYMKSNAYKKYRISKIPSNVGINKTIKKCTFTRQTCRHQGWSSYSLHFVKAMVTRKAFMQFHKLHPHQNAPIPTSVECLKRDLNGMGGTPFHCLTFEGDPLLLIVQFGQFTTSHSTRSIDYFQKIRSVASLCFV